MAQQTPPETSATPAMDSLKAILELANRMMRETPQGNARVNYRWEQWNKVRLLAELGILNQETVDRKTRDADVIDLDSEEVPFTGDDHDIPGYVRPMHGHPGIKGHAHPGGGDPHRHGD